MRPRIIVHNAVSLDLKLTGFDVDMELYYGLAAQWKEDATLAGSATILAAPGEAPPETEADLIPPVPVPGERRAVLVIPDSRGRVRIWHYLRQLPYWRDFIALISESTPRDYIDYLEKRHIKYLVCGKERVDLKTAVERLGSEFNIKTIRVDSGGALITALLEAGLVDEISLLVHPVIAGKESSVSLIHELNKGKIHLKLCKAETLDKGLVWLHYVNASEQGEYSS
ncbi:MAG TPA: RibD family protein [Bacteroidales bacterium]|nr:RibD family protein [Bacteroidales bacterium]